MNRPWVFWLLLTLTLAALAFLIVPDIVNLMRFAGRETSLLIAAGLAMLAMVVVMTRISQREEIRLGGYLPSSRVKLFSYLLFPVSIGIPFSLIYMILLINGLVSQSAAEKGLVSGEAILFSVFSSLSVLVPLTYIACFRILSEWKPVRRWLLGNKRVAAESANCELSS